MVVGHLWCNPKVIQNLNVAQLNRVTIWLLLLDLNIFIIVATVPTGLQTCAKMLKMHLLGGWGTPLMQPKSNVQFK